jgi:maltose O-acetyltransferase
VYHFLKKLYRTFIDFKTKAYLSDLQKKGLSIGDNTYILEPFFLDPDHCALISIGSNCTIAPDSRFIAHDASTKRMLGYSRLGKIVIHDNCFIGASVVILPNVSIGPNSIVGAGSLVNNDIPPGTVAAGNPIRVICSVDDYLEKIKNKSHSQGIFDQSYQNIHLLPADKKQEIYIALEKGEIYMV